MWDEMCCHCTCWRACVPLLLISHACALVARFTYMIGRHNRIPPPHTRDSHGVSCAFAALGPGTAAWYTLLTEMDGKAINETNTKVLTAMASLEVGYTAKLQLVSGLVLYYSLGPGDSRAVQDRYAHRHNRCSAFHSTRTSALRRTSPSILVWEPQSSSLSSRSFHASKRVGSTNHAGQEMSCLGWSH